VYWRDSTHARRFAVARGRIEWRRPWWRRDVIVMALEAAYPNWLSAAHILALCVEIEPAYAPDKFQWTARSLGRLHSYRQVDRIGSRIGARGGAPDGTPLPSVSGTGYRYRLRKI